MKKRLVLLSMLLCSIFGFFACSKDPYDSMTLESSANDIVLIMEEKTVNGSKEYVLEPYEFYVTVSGVDDSEISTAVEVSGGEGLVDVQTKQVKSDQTKITVTPISHEKTGQFSLTIRTVEGNKSIDVNFSLNLKINDFDFEDDNLKVVSKGSEINLNDLEKYLKFTPELTNQRYVDFEIVTPVDGVIPNHEGNYVYESNGNYAEIVDGVLKAYKTNSQGENVVYPQLTESISAGDSSYDETYQCITLKATYVGPNAEEVKIVDKYIDIEVVEDCSDAGLFMNYQQNTNNESSVIDGFFQLEKNDQGEYDVVLLDPLYKYGMNYPTYYIERDLLFNFGEYALGYDPNDYRVVSKQVLDADNLPITLTGIRGENVENNQFKILAQHAGVYSHVFRVEHKDYPEMVNAEIVVNFYVKDLPTDIKINGTSVQESYRVYDYYSSATYGTKFNVDLNNNHGKFDYFVFMKDAVLAESIDLFKGSEVGEQVLGLLDNVGGEDVIRSSVEGREVTKFANLETFFLKHSFEHLPEDPVELCIGIQFSVADDNYSDEIKDFYFSDSIMYVSTYIVAEKGIRDIVFTQSKYMVDLDNPLLTNNLKDNEGVKLFELPEGQTFESAILPDGLEYDEDLITVYPVVGEDNITAFYLKCNDKFVVGETTLKVSTRNGIVRKVNIETFIPTVYANLNPEGSQLPLGMSVDKDQTLYYINVGSNPDQHDEMLSIYKNDEVWSENFQYLSIDTLFILKGNSVDIRFYDYLLTYDNLGQKIVIPMDITDLVKVECSKKTHLSYANGRITAKEVTEKIDTPIILEVSYLGGTVQIDDEGNSVYTTILKRQRIKVYVYIPLQGVQIKNEKDTKIYVDDSLGYDSKYLSSHTIISDFIPNEKTLGSDWNYNWIPGSELPVTLFYDYTSMLNSIIYVDGSTPLTIRAFDSQNERVVYYRDLFTIDVKDYNCEVVCVISNDLKNWILSSESGGGGYSEVNYEDVIKDQIFKYDIYLKINVFIRQFFKLQNINEVSIKAEYATKVSEYNLDIMEDGVYFENRGTAGDLVARVPYTIEEGIDAPDKHFVVVGTEQSLCRTEIVYSPSYNSGEIVIYCGDVYGVDYLTITPRDNIKSIDNGVYTYFDNKIVQQFRVKVANGSIEAPFEIRSVADFEKMQEDIASQESLDANNRHYYYYTLTRNLNLSKANLIQANVLESTADTLNYFYLTGKHSYNRNGVEIVKYLNLYNINIKRTVAESNNNIGLFGKLESNATISNLGIINANINLNVDNVSNVYVGVLAGQVTGVNIYNSSVTGNIKVDANNNTNTYVGGVVGCMEDTLVRGLPGGYQAGVTSSENNVNVMISLQGSATGGKIGGYAGKITGNTISDINVISTIYSDINNASVGGIVGNGDGVSIKNVEVYPVIKATKDNINIGGVVGKTTNNRSSLENAIVYIVKNANGTNWQSVCDIYVNGSNVNVGGLIGSAEGQTKITYSYFRNFYNYNISDTYKGNIYVIAEDGNVGGLVGDNSATLTIEKSYFDGDISAQNTLKVGQLVGSVGVLEITDSYAIGYMQKLISSDTNVTCENVVDIENNFGAFGGLSFVNDANLPALKVDSTASLLIDNVYTVIVNNVVTNSPIYFIGEESKGVYGILGDELLKDVYELSDVTNLSSALFDSKLNYTIKLESNQEDNPVWLGVDKLNTFNNISMPILVNANGKAMYDVLPESIVISRIVETAGFYNVTEDRSEFKQVLMYLNINKDNTNNPSDDNSNDYYYEIKENDGHIQVTFNGLVVFEDYIEVKDDIVITEERDRVSPVVIMVGSKIYPVGEGISTITIASTFDSTIFTKLIIKVVKGITNFDVCDETTFGVQTLTENEILNVYVDEETTFSITNKNIVDGVDYEAINNIIYKLEIVGDDSKNININNQTLNTGDIIYLTTGSFTVKGIVSGDTNIKITPLIPLTGLSHEDRIKEVVSIIDTLDNLANNTYGYDNAKLMSEYNILKGMLKALNNVDGMSVANDLSNYKTACADLAEKYLHYMYSEFYYQTGYVSQGQNVGLTTDYTISCHQKTMAIRFTEKPESLTFRSISNFSVELDTSKFSGSEGSYITTEKLVIKFDDREDVLIDLNSATISPIYHELLNIIFTGIEIEKSSDYDNCVLVTLSGYAELNIDHYRKYAENYNLQDLRYNLTFIPESNYFNNQVVNEKITDTLSIQIKPTSLSFVDTNYYSKGELLSNDLGYNGATENESDYIIPGRYGLLKITLDEEFTNSNFVAITMNNIYSDYIKLSQVAGEATYVNGVIDPYGEIKGYNDIATSRFYPITHPEESGIRLVKVTLNNEDDSYFSKTYYVKVFMTKEYESLSEDDVVFNIRSYDYEGNETSIPGGVKSLEIKELPSINIRVDNEYDVNLGLGTLKPLDITVKGIENPVTIEGVNSNLQILDEDYNPVRSLDLSSYTNEDKTDDKKYYVYANISNTNFNTLLNQSYTLTFKTSHFIENVLEVTSCQLELNVVDFEIESVKMSQAVASDNNKITIKHGQSYYVDVAIKAREIVILDKNNDEYNQKVEDYREIIKTKVAQLELLAAGKSEGAIHSTNPINLKYKHIVNGYTVWSNFTTSTNINYVRLDKYEDAEESYYIIKGVSINDNNTLVNLRLYVPYHYGSGLLVYGEEGAINGYENYVLDFSMLIEDTSSDENPTPIENQTQFESICGPTPPVGNGHYILLDNIELVDWVPLEANFKSLDGNGYVIKVKNFALSASQGVTDANIGIFSEVSENTLLKNLTIDVSDLLVTSDEVERDKNELSKSTKETYHYDTEINAAFTNNVNFGMIAGINNGSITNAKIVNFGNEQNEYLHVVTTLGNIEGSAVTTNIGSLVGINKGVITNSYAGLNISTINSNGSATLQCVEVPNSEFVSLPNGDVMHMATLLNNKSDTLVNKPIYSFTVAGGNIIGGLVAQNSGVISNSYTKGLGVYNTYHAVTEGKTGGFVAVNDSVITSAFSEGAQILNYRAKEDTFVIESKGNVGGFVYENKGTIENAYSNVYLVTESAFIGGFVYDNSGKITNAYTTTVNRNNLAHGQFTGIAVDGRTVLNSDPNNYDSCYYLVLEGEYVNKFEDAMAIENNVSPISNTVTWRGFSFSTVQNVEGIWKITDGYTPRISSAFVETKSFRRLVEILDDPNNTGNNTNSDNKYSYEYIGNNIGSLENPLLINSVEEFSSKIIDYAINREDAAGNEFRVFGAYADRANTTSRKGVIKHIRLINNLDFNTTALSGFKASGVEYYLQNLIFAGVLDGNGMSMTNLKISDAKSTNFGLFSQIGLYVDGEDLGQSVIKNLNMSISSYTGTNVYNAGILAGTIVNANIVNVNIDGGNISIMGNNTAGGLAGVIKAEGDGRITIHNVEVTNVSLHASHNSMGVSINAETQEKSDGTYKKFAVPNADGVIDASSENTFKSLYTIPEGKDDYQTDLNELRNVSYAGAIAGVIIANNYNEDVKTEASKYADYKAGVVGGGDPTNSSISNVKVSSSIEIINADQAGGLFGYVSENTIIKDSAFIVNSNQMLKGRNFVGGLVGENHGVIDECYIALDDIEQEKIDKSLVNVNSEQVVSNIQLFEQKDDASYTVAIGGIAGYSSDGVIIDSYAKVNVTKSNAYIAGGIIGYAENYNYLGSVYNSNVVYGKYVIGGVIGLQTNSSTESLHMDNVVSVTNWGAITQDKNYMHLIASRLYDNQKDLYLDDKMEPKNFYIKLPEIGNYTLGNIKYNPNKYYIGSVVGSYKVKSGSNYKQLVSSDDIVDNYENVHSSTLGNYSYEGTVSSGKKVDSYANSVEFTTSTGKVIDLYSYRIAYDNDDNKSNIATFVIDGYEDNYSFDKVFTAQSYMQQLIGQYYYKDGSASKKAAGNFGAFAENSDVWYIKNNLPEFSHGIYASSATIENNDDLVKAFTNGTGGVDYTVESGNYTLSVTSGDVQFVRPLRNNFKGEDDCVVNIGTASSTLGSIFGTISGASFDNIEFNITVSAIDIARSTSNYGLISNIIENSSIKNCIFNINVTSGNFNVEDFNTIKNLGLLFGQMNNTMFENNEVNITIGDIALNTNITNFGLIAGSTKNSTIRNNQIDTNNLSITVSVGENIAGLIGSFNYSTYEQNEFDSQVTITDNSTSTVNVSAVIGYANNSNVNDIESSAKVSYSGTVNKAVVKQVTDKDGNVTDEPEVDSVNIAILVAKAYGTVFSDVKLTGTVTSSATVEDMYSVGSVVGYADDGTLLESCSSTGNISVNGTCNNMSVGGLVGFAYGSFTIKDSYTKGEISVNNTNTGSDSEKAYTSVGGLLGYSSSNSSIYDVYSIAEVSYNGNSSVNSISAVGGLVGYNKGTINMSRFVALNDFVGSCKYTSGVVGLNNGLFIGENGYAYVELPNSGITSNITNNSISSSTNNVFYAQEFVGNNYDSDRKFIPFAMGDLFESISEYSSIYVLDNVFTQVSYGSIELFLPNSISDTLGSFESETGNTRFDPVEFSAGVEGYSVITTTGTYTIDTLSGVISGRSAESGKVVVVAGESDPFVTTNNGVISNIYFNANGKGQSVVATNNGLITNVYVYGETGSQSPIGTTNIGKIYQSATSVVYRPGVTEFYGFVRNNGGVISDSYSSSFGYSASHAELSIYGFAENNYYADTEKFGTISNSFYFIHDWMVDENSSEGVVENGELYEKDAEDKDVLVGKGVVTNVYNNKQPSFTKNLPMWYVENDHAQLKGFKDIANKIYVNILFNNVNGIENIKRNIIDNIASPGMVGYEFNYTLEFYEDSDNSGVLADTVVRISNGNQLVNYINSLEGSIIPSNTIVMIVKDITVSSSIKSFSIPSTSAFIGINNPTITFSGTRSSALIKNNSGLLGGFEIKNLSIKHVLVEGAHLDSDIAPILVNQGVIINLPMSNTKIDGGFVTVVTGAVVENKIGGCIYNLVHTDTTIIATNMWCMTSKMNNGLYYRFTHQDITISGGVEYHIDD